jgi:ABC-2 type transport system permease protein
VGTTWRRAFAVSAWVLRLGFRKQLEYPGALAVWFLIIPFQHLTGVWLLKILVDRYQPLAGWTAPQIAFVYGLGLLSHGLQRAFFSQAWYVDDWISEGRFDRLLVQPMGVYFGFQVLHFSPLGFLDLIPAFPLFIYASHLVGFAWTPAHVGQVLVVVLGATLIRTAVYTLAGSMAFWTERSQVLVDMAVGSAERSTMYPLAIYPWVIQMALTFLVPLGFVSFYPACGFLGHDARTRLPLDLVLWTPVIGVGLFAFALWHFNAGLARYESSGS